MSDRRRGRALMWTADRKAVAMERICDRIAAGEHLRDICADPWMPSRVSIFDWVRSDPELRRQYQRALEVRTDLRSERIDSYTRDLIAGKITAEAARVAIDAQKWLASKECPRRYGRQAQIERPSTEHLTDEQLDARINQLISKTTAVPAVALPVRTQARARVMGS